MRRLASMRYGPNRYVKGTALPSYVVMKVPIGSVVIARTRSRRGFEVWLTAQRRAPCGSCRRTLSIFIKSAIDSRRRIVRRHGQP
jgi:hypothetical protein